jgi:hypothetical protein
MEEVMNSEEDNCMSCFWEKDGRCQNEDSSNFGNKVNSTMVCELHEE